MLALNKIYTSNEHVMCHVTKDYRFRCTNLTRVVSTIYMSNIWKQFYLVYLHEHHLKTVLLIYLREKNLKTVDWYVYVRIVFYTCTRATSENCFIAWYDYVSHIWKQFYWYVYRSEQHLKQFYWYVYVSNIWK